MNVNPGRNVPGFFVKPLKFKMMCNCQEDDDFDIYTHAPLGDEAANALYYTEQKALKAQIEALQLVMRSETDPATLATQNGQLNTLVTQLAMQRRLCFGEAYR